MWSLRHLAHIDHCSPLKFPVAQWLEHPASVDLNPICESPHINYLSISFIHSESILLDCMMQLNVVCSLTQCDRVMWLLCHITHINHCTQRDFPVAQWLEYPTSIQSWSFFFWTGLLPCFVFMTVNLKPLCDQSTNIMSKFF